MSARLWEQDIIKKALQNLRQAALYKKISRFFMKSPAPSGLQPNRKGKGFHLFKIPQQEQDITALKKRILIGSLIGAACAFALLMLVGQHSTLDFTMLVTTTLALCGLVAYDIVSRRFWEQKIESRIEKLCSNHDRLVREVARNRGDIAVIKEGLGEMARNVEDQGRNMPPASTVEGRMIETMVGRLGALGDKPRAEVRTSYSGDILELEMTPPPSRPLPMTDLDSELDDDHSKISDSAIANLLQHAVHDDKIDIFMQPIVNLPQRKARMIELYGRLRAGAGTYVPAGRYLPLAEQEDMVSALDNLLLLRCLQMLRDSRHKDNNISYVLNVAGASLNDRSFMNDLVAFLTKDHHIARRLVFELPQRELTTLSKDIAPILEGLSKLGCRFSMDRVRNRKIDISLLKSLHIRFIKLDAGWLIKEGASHAGFSRIARLKKQLDAAGIDLIVERIEDENDLRELLDFNIDYGQGYLFGKPDHQAAYRSLKAA